MSATSLTGSNYTAQYIGAEQFINKRDIYNKIFDRYREEGLADLLINLGKKRKTDNTTFHHHEHDFLINEAIVDSVVAFEAHLAAGETLTTTQNTGNNDEIKSAYRQREFSSAFADKEFAFIDQLETPVAFWKNALFFLSYHFAINSVLLQGFNRIITITCYLTFIIC